MTAVDEGLGGPPMPELWAAVKPLVRKLPRIPGHDHLKHFASFAWPRKPEDDPMKRDAEIDMFASASIASLAGKYVFKLCDDKCVHPGIVCRVQTPLNHCSLVQPPSP